MVKIIAVCNECGFDNSHLFKVKSEEHTDFQAINCGSCGFLFQGYSIPDREKSPEEITKENVEKYGMLGMIMNPYAPFDVRIDYEYEEQRLLRELEGVRKAKAEAHLTLEERYDRAVASIIKTMEDYDKEKELAKLTERNRR